MHPAPDQPDRRQKTHPRGKAGVCRWLLKKLLLLVFEPLTSTLSPGHEAVYWPKVHPVPAWPDRNQLPGCRAWIEAAWRSLSRGSVFFRVHACMLWFPLVMPPVHCECRSHKKVSQDGAAFRRGEVVHEMEARLAIRGNAISLPVGRSCRKGSAGYSRRVLIGRSASGCGCSGPAHAPHEPDPDT